MVARKLFTSRARWPWSVALIAAALTLSLLLGTAFLLVSHLRPSARAIDHPAAPLTDGQTMAQVMGPAKEIVTVAQLQTATAGYLLMSCRNAHDPPYQGAVFLDFRLPTASNGDTLVYLRRVRDALVANGWSEGLPPNRHLSGHALDKAGVTAIFYQNPDQANFGTMQLYGECRNTTDHTGDRSGWTDVTGQLG